MKHKTCTNLSYSAYAPTCVLYMRAHILCMVETCVCIHLCIVGKLVCAYMCAKGTHVYTHTNMGA